MSVKDEAQSACRGLSWKHPEKLHQRRHPQSSYKTDTHGNIINDDFCSSCGKDVDSGSELFIIHPSQLLLWTVLYSVRHI
mmetsp:Transcript_22808/g.67360  ORF Transcript_22808/g.67360 Transcript_22808/m.67360 type:complete len:80 (-) Transcript_22808:426-665(-)